MFSHKYILRVFIFLVLTLIVTNIALPKIEDYNETVREEQERLQRQADGTARHGISFGLYSLTSADGTSTFLLSVLFLSLVFTKRIFLSFLASFLFGIQMIASMLIMPKIRGLSYFPYPVSYYSEFLLATGMLALAFWTAFSICNFCHRRMQSNIFLK